ncbi:MAG: TIGR01210 family radical SAM protein [Methanobacteriota archaeon]|nr:MAG: TIGR01210 family radical SAM protein [Euryarchaeota archaeon]
MVDERVNEAVRSIRQKALRRSKGSGRIVSWRERDFLDGETVDAGVVILPTKGCRWGRASGCTMCGYVYEAGSLDDGTLAARFREALASLDVPYLKVFTSGSFFDPQEVSEALLGSIIDAVNEAGVKRFQVESRPEFLTAEAIGDVQSRLEPALEVGIGLETSNDFIRESCINKGFSFDDYREAAELCKANDVLVKTYLLLKPPFILEREAIEDTVKSALDAAEAGSDRISINPMNIQRGTLVEMLWRRGEYRPPWLWSLVEVLKEITDADPGVPVLSHPTAAGKPRGAHNCGACDQTVAEAIKEFSITQDPGHLEGLDCRCKKHWKDYLLLE